jgi:lipoate-protein ligase A
MHEDNIKLVRRQSGGGCVYHDENNVNFSFIADKQLHDKNWNHQFIVDVLKNLGIGSIFSERGDMRLDEVLKRKISGSAFKEKKDTAFHHGTMLIRTDLEKLNHYIHSNKSQLESKSIQSIRSVVSNLSDVKKGVTNKVFIDAMADNFCDQGFIEIIDHSHALYRSAIEGDYLKKIKSFEWIYIETPKFLVNHSTNNFNIELTVKKTMIEKIEIDSDSLHPIVISNLCETLINTSLFDKVDENQLVDDSALEVIAWMSEFFELKTLPGV